MKAVRISLIILLFILLIGGTIVSLLLLNFELFLVNKKELITFNHNQDSKYKIISTQGNATTNSTLTLKAIKKEKEVITDIKETVYYKKCKELTKLSDSSYNLILIDMYNDIDTFNIVFSKDSTYLELN